MAALTPAPVGWLHVVQDLPPDGAPGAERFWAAALAWPLGAPWPGRPEFASFEPPDGDAYVHRQRGDHGPRTHLDLEVDDPATQRDRLVALGASAGEPFPDWWPMTSPGGLPFCLVRSRPRTRPPAPTVRAEGGAEVRTRLVQLCIDSPAERNTEEVAFWRAATGWAWQPGDAPQFAGKLRGDSPVQLLLQRLGVDDTRTAVTAHVDLGTDDLRADADRLVGLGAELIGPGDGWITLRDPAGSLFCTTRNAPR